MNYFNYMRKVLAFQPPDSMGDRWSIWYCGLNVMLAGLGYAATVLLLSSKLASGAYVNPWMILAAGIVTAYFVHAGAALMVWVFCKGVGGTQLFLPIYLNMGIAFIALWPMAPALAGMQLSSSFAVLLLVAVTATYALVVMVASIAAVVDLSKFRLALAMSATLIYLGCFMYLWT